jgi:hypothetical protein
VTESELQSGIIDLARLFRWRVAHFRPAQTSKGWRTPVAADGKGFPDLVLVRDRVVFAELKAARGVVSAAQTEWAQALTGAGVEVYLWRPDDWTAGRIDKVLA